MTEAKKKVVFLVDDDPQILASVGRALRTLPVEVRLAIGGNEALKELVKDPPDLLIADYQMPWMDGFTLIQEVRKRFPKVKCILHTGASAAVPRAGAAERSWNLDIPILFKPCSNEIVRELVGGVLEL